MDKAASIFLRPEIGAEDIRYLAHWLRSERVTRYLNEEADTPEALERLLSSTPEPLLQCRLSRLGRFFMVCRDWGTPIGFIRLVEQAAGDYEIVFAIGDETLWGRGCGSQALQAAMRLVFLDWRARRLTARIYHGNQRSVNTVCGCGFLRERSGAQLDAYGIRMAEYLELLCAPAGQDRPVGSLA
jgi:RimJ/RimL family protein N-acetyltransferase